MKNRIAFTLTAVACVLVVGSTGVFMYREFTKASTFVSMGDIWSMLRLDTDRHFAPFAEVDPDDFPHPPYPVQGDFLIKINDLPATLDNYFSVFTPDTPPGEEVEIKFSHESIVYTTTAITRSIPEQIEAQVWVMFVLRALIVFGLIFVGLWGFVRKPLSPAVRALTLFCLVLSMEMCITQTTINDTYADFQIPVWVFFAFASLCFFSPAFWVKLHLLFPKRNSEYDRRPVVFNLLLFFPAAAICAFWATSVKDFPMLVVTIYRTLFMGIGFFLLIRNYLRTDDFIEKRQTRLVLWGSAPGIGIYVVFSWIITAFPSLIVQWSYRFNMLVSNIVFLFVLLIPISFIYAFGKYKLLEVEGKLRRGTRFIAVNLAILITFFGLLYVFGVLLLSKIGIHSRTPTLILGILLALAFMPTQHKLRAKLEEHFFPERERLRKLLRDFLASSMVRSGGSEFWKELEEKLADVLFAEKIYPVLRIEDKGVFAVELSEPAPFDMTDEIIKRLGDKDNPMLLDEVIASGRILLTPEQKKWFIARKSAILLPLVAKSGLVGFLVISRKTNGEDFTSEELDILGSFSAQTALVAENFELQDNKIEKEKLEEQINVARNIQEGLLPKDIPVTPGLEARALIRFSMDVAGDYYDVIPLPDGRMIYAIGDVAGKGVGPALLMANLQASLRITQELDVPLAESAAKINKILFENTPSDLFITFFMACIDPVTGRLTYVNAGHNPPLLIRKNKKVRKLSQGGLLLGVDPDTVYSEGELDFQPGDLLLMYTDGVSEAMNSSEEEFGEQRIASVAVANRHLPLHELLWIIEKRVTDYHESSEFSDDFTLLAVRRRTIQAGG